MTHCHRMSGRVNFRALSVPGFLLTAGLPLLALFILVSPLAAQVGPWVPASTPLADGCLPSPDTQSINTGFGQALSVSGEVLAVSNFYVERVFVFERDVLTGEWLQGVTDGAIGELLSPIFPQWSWFGWALAVDGSRMVVGAPFYVENGAFEGIAYLYDRDPVTAEWLLTETIANPGTGIVDGRFGEAVALDGDRLAIGDPIYLATAGQSHGRVVIHERDSLTGEWLETALISNPGNTIWEEDNFGNAVSLSGDVLAVGAPWAAVGTGLGVPYSGRVDVFEQDSTSGDWLLTSVLENPTPGVFDEFGLKLALSGDLLAVGVYQDAPFGVINDGSVYLYQRQGPGTEWLPVDTSNLGGTIPGQIPPPIPLLEESFGSSVAIDGQTLAIGANRAEVNGIVGAGSSYLYGVDGGGQWQLLQSIANPDPRENETYGTSVGISNTVLAVGTPGYQVVGGSAIGAVYLYESDLFLRGDVNGDGIANIGDPVSLLAYLFNGAEVPGCLDACDGNDDGANNLADAISILNALFVPGTPPLPSPAGACGQDPTPDSLDCLEAGDCQ